MRYTNDELRHFGVMGMRWGRRRAQSAAKAGSRDAADLRKHGFKKEAAAVQKNANKEKKLASKLDRQIKAKQLALKTAKKLKQQRISEIKSRPISWGRVLISTALIGPLGTVIVGAGAPELFRPKPRE